MRRTAATVAAVLLVVLPTTPAVAAWEGTPVPSAESAEQAVSATSSAQLVGGQVTVSVDSLAPEVLSSGQSVTVSGTVANGGTDALEDLTVTAQVQRSTELTTTGLESWLADDQDTQEDDSDLEKAYSGPLDVRVGPGEIRSFSLTVTAEDLPLDETDQWGPRGLQITISRDRTEVAHDRTVLLWDAGKAVAPSHVTTLIPVTASPAELQFLTASSVEPSGNDLAKLRSRVTSLLNLAGDGVVLAVDPALLEALGVDQDVLETPGGSQETPGASGTPEAPTTPGDGTSTGTSSTPPTPSPSPSPSDSDSDNQTIGKQPDRTLTRTLERAVRTGDVVTLPWADTDVSALAHLGETGLLEETATRAGDSESASMGAPASLTWLAGNLDLQTLDSLPDATSTIVTVPGDMPVTDDVTYTPSNVTTVDSHPVLVPNRNLSETLGGNLATEDSSRELSDLDALQLLRGETAILTRQAPSLSRSWVIALNRVDAVSMDVASLEGRLTALRESAWVSVQNLDALTTETQAHADDDSAPHRADVPNQVVEEGEVPVSDLVEARSARSYLDSVASILTDPAAAIGPAADVVERIAAAGWRSDAEGRTAMTTAARARGATVTTKLTAVPSRTVNLIASEANLPVRIMSSLDQDATVVVRLQSDSARLQTVKDVSITIPAGGQTTATLPVRAVGSGDVDLTVILLAGDSTVISAPQTVHMRIRADWETKGTRAAGAGLAVLLMGGIVRTVRRGRRTVVPRASETSIIEEKA